MEDDVTYNMVICDSKNGYSDRHVVNHTCEKSEEIFLSNFESEKRI